MAWTNDDGLYVKFGTELATATQGGQYRDAAELIVVEIEFDYADLAATGTEKVMADNVIIPNGAHIEKAELYVQTVFSTGSSPTLTIGLIDQDRTTAIDADGIDATIAAAALTAGATIACDGALINTTLTNSGLVTMTEGTAAFTTGAGRLRIYYYIA